MPGYLESYEAKEEEATGSIDYLKGNLFQKITLDIKLGSIVVLRRLQNLRTSQWSQRTGFLMEAVDLETLV